jgi:hypothetical protein
LSWCAGANTSVRTRRKLVSLDRKTRRHGYV